MVTCHFAVEIDGFLAAFSPVGCLSHTFLVQCVFVSALRPFLARSFVTDFHVAIGYKAEANDKKHQTFNPPKHHSACHLHMSPTHDNPGLHTHKLRTF